MIKFRLFCFRYKTVYKFPFTRVKLSHIGVLKVRPLLYLQTMLALNCTFLPLIKPQPQESETKSWPCDTIKASFCLFSPHSASGTTNGSPVALVMHPGHTLLSCCSLCPPAHGVFSRGRTPIDSAHAPPWFMSHLSHLMFLSP